MKKVILVFAVWILCVFSGKCEEKKGERGITDENPYISGEESETKKEEFKDAKLEVCKAIIMDRLERDPIYFEKVLQSVSKNNEKNEKTDRLFSLIMLTCVSRIKRDLVLYSKKMDFKNLNSLTKENVYNLGLEKWAEIFKTEDSQKLEVDIREFAQTLSEYEVERKKIIQQQEAEKGNIETEAERKHYRSSPKQAYFENLKKGQAGETNKQIRELKAQLLEKLIQDDNDIITYDYKLDLIRDNAADKNQEEEFSKKLYQIEKARGRNFDDKVIWPETKNNETTTGNRANDELVENSRNHTNTTNTKNPINSTKNTQSDSKSTKEKSTLRKLAIVAKNIIKTIRTKVNNLERIELVGYTVGFLVAIVLFIMIINSCKRSKQQNKEDGKHYNNPGKKKKK